MRDLEEKTVERLKKRAAKNGRSLQAEVRMILERQAEEIDMLEGARLIESIRRRFAGKRFSDSTELLREDRER